MERRRACRLKLAVPKGAVHVKSLNPGYKFLTLLIASLILSVTHNTRLNLSVFALCFAAAVCEPSVNRRRLIFGLAPFLLTAGGMFMSGFLFPSASVSASLVGAADKVIYVTSWDSALKLSSRILAFGGIGLLFAFTTDSMDFVMSLTQQFRLPPKFAYGLLAAYHFFPVIRDEYGIVRSALAVRGVKAGPFSRKCLLPMLIHAFERSESVAMAMESRGFDGSAVRGVAFPVPLRKTDFAFMFAVTAGILAGWAWM
ncbi:MAG: energy-coupling factor transporter transmembrane protein EcfT [Synergistaceae bacterium]|jgi:energy-coupling factor transporter transmembrane protein EcfT|nr:energy-coupling factor transporter transmembrane protein EcfT [Synergistaceae bacterium]